jgi:host factor-I protein
MGGSYGLQAKRLHPFDSLRNDLPRGSTVTVQRTPMIQDMFPKHLRDSEIEVMMFLVNGIKLVGRIRRFDQYTVQLARGAGTQIVYKHAISAINPAEPVQLTDPI